MEANFFLLILKPRDVNFVQECQKCQICGYLGKTRIKILQKNTSVHKTTRTVCKAFCCYIVFEEVLDVDLLQWSLRSLSGCATAYCAGGLPLQLQHSTSAK